VYYLKTSQLLAMPVPDFKKAMTQLSIIR